MITADQLVLHAIGDYVLQSDWVANTKTSKSIACLVHVIIYTLPFLILTQSPWALAFIAGTHFVIDRWRLARYVCWAKNFLQPKFRVEFGHTSGGMSVGYIHNYPWSECSATGYHKDRPAWMSVWLMIATDNVLHVICNGIALTYLV